MKPLCIDLFCGLGGWTEGFLSEGYEVIGFDIENHIYGEHRYHAQLVLQDVRTLHGSQFKDAAIIVASSPCQEFSYRAMPWKRAKALGPPVLGMELFAQAGRIQREAIEAAGRYIPMVQENVKGAQPYVGRANWHYGSYYLWGDVPALMPITHRVAKQNREVLQKDGHNVILPQVVNREGMKNTGGSWFNIGSPGQLVTNNNPVARGDGRKLGGAAYQEGAVLPTGTGKTSWCFGNTKHELRASSSNSKTRKAASARIAKIPFPLAQWIARVNREALGKVA